MSKIFISHSVKDKEIADSFIDLILQNGLSVPIKEIFCSSIDGTMIESGDDWRMAVKEKIQSAKVTILLISPYFKESEVCVCEMGGAWITESKVIPLIIEPISYRTVGVIHKPLQIEKLLKEESLDRLKDIIQKELVIDSQLIKSDRWTVKKKEFIVKVNNYLKSFSYPIPMDRIKFDELLQEQNDLEKTIGGLIDEKRNLTELVAKLKAAKDENEISEIIRQQSSQYESFNELIITVKKLLKQNHPILNGMIYRAFTHKEININTDINREAIDEAFANNYVNDELEVRWDATKYMKKVSLSLSNLSRFMNSDLKTDFYELYEDNFESEFDITDKSFWEELFEIVVTFK